MTGVCQISLLLYCCNKEKEMFEKLLTIMFNRQTERKKTDKCITFISKNREIDTSVQVLDRTSLSRYFNNLSSLNEVAKQYRGITTAVKRSPQLSVKSLDLHH